MREADRQRIEQRLQEIEHWRASGMELCDYARQNGETVMQWRGKLSWEQRWRQLLQGHTLPKLQRSNKATEHAFVKAQPEAANIACTQTNSRTHLRITLSGRSTHTDTPGLQAQVDWPLEQLHISSQWLREVLA